MLILQKRSVNSTIRCRCRVKGHGNQQKALSRASSLRKGFNPLSAGMAGANVLDGFADSLMYQIFLDKMKCLFMPPAEACEDFTYSAE